MDKKLVTSPLPHDSVYNAMWIRYSEIECEVYAISSRIVRTKAEVDSVLSNIKKRQSVLCNLRSSATTIVSMKEYSKVYDELRTLTKALDDKTEYLTYDRRRVEELRRELVSLKARMDNRLNPNNVLQFRTIS
jgi:flagellar biosynthesis chaperone FliJ